MTYRVLLSHSSKDIELVQQVYDLGGTVGVEVYLFEHDRQPGRDVVSEVQTAIRACDAMVVLLTNQGVASAYAQQEIGFALQDKKLVIPVVETGVKDADLAMLQRIEYIPLDPSTPDDALSDLGLRMEELARFQQRREKTQADLILAGGMLVLLALAYASSASS